jgi:hypothetical protein
VVKKGYVTLCVNCLDGAKESCKVWTKTYALQFTTSSQEISQLKTIFRSSITVSIHNGFLAASKQIQAANNSLFMRQTTSELEFVNVIVQNVWKIFTLVLTSKTDPLDVTEAKREVLDGIAARMAKEIESSSYGAVVIEDEATHRYYLVQWTSVPCTLQEEMDEFQEGKLVCDGTYLNPVG